MVMNNKAKMILVDDEAFNILAIKGMMRVLGMTNIDEKVEECFNGLECVNLIENAINENQSERYSLILTDCKMPIMDGYESTKRIRKLFKAESEKNIIMSGSSQEAYEE